MATEERPPQAGDEATGVDEQVAGTGDEGRAAAAASPPIADDAASQTRSPAPADDVGVPPDDEMGRPDE